MKKKYIKPITEFIVTRSGQIVSDSLVQQLKGGRYEKEIY